MSGYAGLDQFHSFDLLRTEADCFVHRTQIEATGSTTPCQTCSSQCSRHILHFSSVDMPARARTNSEYATVKQFPQTILPLCPSIQGTSFAHAVFPQKSQRISSGCTLFSSIPSLCINPLAIKSSHEMGGLPFYIFSQSLCRPVHHRRQNLLD